MQNLVGLIYTGRAGVSPFDPSVYSSSSRAIFSGLERRQVLRTAHGIGLPPLQRYARLLANVRFDMRLWQRQYLSDLGLRHALTRQVAGLLAPDDPDQRILQIGVMFDTPSLLEGTVPCYSYNDGCLAEKIDNAIWPRGMSRRLIDQTLDYERRVQNSMTKVFTFSDYLRTSMIRNYGVPPERVVSIGGGVNLDQIPEQIPDRDYDRHELLFIGIDFERKGGWQLLEAFAALRERLPDARLHIVGPKKLDVRAKLAGGVEFHGFLSKQDPIQAARLHELFVTCSLFVMPSLYEPYGIAPLEAMVHKLPCLVSDGWALREMVVPGETGDLVDVGSVESLREKMLQLLTSPEDLRRMGDTGRQLVLGQYLWDHVLDRMLAQLEPSERCRAPVQVTSRSPSELQNSDR